MPIELFIQKEALYLNLIYTFGVCITHASTSGFLPAFNSKFSRLIKIWGGYLNSLHTHPAYNSLKLQFQIILKVKQ